jgi:hypothetical protein
VGLHKVATKCGVDHLIGLVLALSALLVYALTLSPSLAGEEDQGELAAAVYTLGNTHPTGYPLFVLIGRVFAMLPLGDWHFLCSTTFSSPCCAAAL